jgi:hypothetical protein
MDETVPSRRSRRHGLQILASGVHLSRGEKKEVSLNVALIALAGVTVWLATVW